MQGGLWCCPALVTGGPWLWKHGEGWVALVETTALLGGIAGARQHPPALRRGHG